MIPPTAPAETRECAVCETTRPCRWRQGSKAWVCESCWGKVPGQAIAAYMRLKERIKHGTLWQEVFGR